MNDDLKPGEPHPAIETARQYMAGLSAEKLMNYLEAFSSCAIGDNRLGEICSGTLDRLRNGQPVSDRYFLGLAWAIRNMEESHEPKR